MNARIGSSIIRKNFAVWLKVSPKVSLFTETARFVNQAWADILGYEGPDDILLTSLEAHFAPHERDRLIEYNRARMRGELPPTQYEYQAVRKDGRLTGSVARRCCLEGEPIIRRRLVSNASASNRYRQRKPHFLTCCGIDPGHRSIHFKPLL